MSEFVKNFFRDNTSESSTRLVMIVTAANVNLMCLATIIIYQIDSKKDFSTQCALLSGLLLGLVGSMKTIQKWKEPQTTKENENGKSL